MTTSHAAPSAATTPSARPIPFHVQPLILTPCKRSLHGHGSPHGASVSYRARRLLCHSATWSSQPWQGVIQMVQDMGSGGSRKIKEGASIPVQWTRVLEHVSRVESDLDELRQDRAWREGRPGEVYSKWLEQYTELQRQGSEMLLAALHEDMQLERERLE
eukprot:CAMPEP_0202906150 /NCGR_PEP_ID=MMETSP1392-20130828/37541_1 /ASSEMBLY_ACC=CAM_ASM_000868 /TAXON_ID=225041 /ORGANISM="Chlamydomonas chlamydogama, Strain SAG 11-48b" /LENGTH=159 /DNA_ID=CAMNT_0049594519 /DNA_START=218 /DNA_END=694 /DNA_ORIENTATION=-